VRLWEEHPPGAVSETIVAHGHGSDRVNAVAQPLVCQFVWADPPKA
jgi:hypothetical protein